MALQFCGSSLSSYENQSENCESFGANPATEALMFSSSENTLARPPMLLPTTLRHQVFLYCYSKEFSKETTDLQICHGCKFNLLSQSSHHGCQTGENRMILMKQKKAVNKNILIQRLQKLASQLLLEHYSSDEIDFLFKKCSSKWCSLVINCVLYDFVCFPFEWSCI